MFNFGFHKPRPFVPRHLRAELHERCSYEGQVDEPVDLGPLPAIVDAFRQEGVEAIAICFLHAYLNGMNERTVADRIRELWPGVSVLPSHSVSREWREYERTNTVVLSAYVQPITCRYVESLESKLREADSGRNRT